LSSRLSHPSLHINIRNFSLVLAQDHVTCSHKGFGFVEYAEPREATLALLTLNTFNLGGRVLKIEFPRSLQHNKAASSYAPAPPSTPSKL